MPNKLHNVEEKLRDVYDGLSESDFISTSTHKSLERSILYIRNAAVAMAVFLFLLSLFDFVGRHVVKAAAYFLGAAAYLCEVLILTDCFQTKIPPHEMFMCYCFGPMYILMGISSLVG